MLVIIGFSSCSSREKSSYEKIQGKWTAEFENEKITIDFVEDTVYNTYGNQAANPCRFEIKNDLLIIYSFQNDTARIIELNEKKLILRPKKLLTESVPVIFIVDFKKEP